MKPSRDVTITLKPGGRRFTARPDETVLNAALRQGVILPYSCKNGACASCKGRIVSGGVRYPLLPPLGLDLEDQLDGCALLCQAVAEDDLEVEARPLEQVADIPLCLMPVRVDDLTLLSPHVMRLRLKMPSARRLQFLAGQYVDILLPGGKRRAFSIASPPTRGDDLELHVKHISGGGFTSHVFDGMQLKDILRIEGPLGTFFVRNADRPMIMVAGGTGFAPLKAMVEDLLAHGSTRSIHLYWGARNRAELYLHDTAERWAREHEHIHYTPVLSDAGNDAWAGRRGWVHEAVVRDRPDLAAFDVYMSGPPAMIDAGRHAFVAGGLDEKNLFYDSFDFAPDVMLG